MSEPRLTDIEALEQAKAIGHELRDIRSARVALVGVGLLGLVALALGMMYGLLSVLQGERPRADALTAPPPAARMLRREFPVNQRVLRLRQEAAQRQVLESYAWLDRDDAIARIPVDRAIEVLSARGESSLRSLGDAANADRETEADEQNGEGTDDTL